MPEPFAGARWWKFDFHTHTPASLDTPWSGIENEKERLSPEQWLLRFMEAQIARVAASRDDQGALLDDTTIGVIYRKDRGRFRIRWRRGDASIEERSGADAWSSSPGDVQGRFPVRIFSQKQIFALAADPDALVRLVDDALPAEQAEHERRRRRRETRYLSLRGQIRELEARLADRSRVEGELADVERQLAGVLRGIENDRTEISRVRMALLDGVLAGNRFVAMAVIPFGRDARAAEPALRQRLGRQDEHLQQDILAADGDSGILADLYRGLPADFDERVAAVRERVAVVKRDVATIAAGGHVEGRTKWFHNHVQDARHA